MSERRELEFSSMAEVIEDIEQMASSQHRTTGNHSFAKIVKHLATTNEMLVGKIVPPKLPWYMRMMMPMMRSKILSGPVEPGFKLPSDQMQSFFWSVEEPDLSEAIEQFKQSAEVYKNQGPLPAHPIFGKATPEQIDGLTLKHAAMHLSFVHSQ